MHPIRIHATTQDYAEYLQCLVSQIGYGARVDSCAIPSPQRAKRGKPFLTIVESDREQLLEALQPSRKHPVVIISRTRPEQHESAEADVLWFTKPLQPARFTTAIHHRLETLGANNHKQLMFEPYLIGNSHCMQAIRQTLGRISRTDLTVLIGGETGTGKGLLALALHNNSRRRSGPFLEVNCSNIPASLLESELFGYKKGSFTGAWNDKPGKFDLANTGTIFLDEISEMTSTMQAKLLQVLQDGRFTAIGSNDATLVDVRIVSASNAELDQLVEDGRFRRDLYYRLNVIAIRLPPLRDRREDIGILKEHFIEKYSSLYNRQPITMSKDLCLLFEDYHWPGNVRELESAVKTCVAVGNDSLIFDDLRKKCGTPRKRRKVWKPPPTLQDDIGRISLKDISRQVAQGVEKEAIGETLAETQGNKKKTAQLLAISYKSLLTKIKQYGLE